MTAIRTIKKNIGATIARVIPGKVRAAAYVRVSTDEQSIDNQLPAIQSLTADKGWTLTEVYSEAESAWRAGHQRELERLFDDLESGKRKYDKLVIWSMDRLTRQGINEILRIMAKLSACKCDVVSVQEPFLECDGLAKDLLITLLAWIAKFESDRRSKRILEGNARKAKLENWTPGRQKGAKDRGKRDNRGYKERWNKRLNRVAARSTPEGASVE